MHRTKVLLPATIAFVVACLALPAPLLAQNRSEESAIRSTVEAYFQGITEHDSLALRKAFDPEAELKYVGSDGSVHVIPFVDWIKFTRRMPSPGNKRNVIESVDVAGTAAVAKTDLEWPGVHYVDYLSLLKVDGIWRIVTKIWWQEPR